MSGTKWLTVDEIAERLRVSRMTVYRLVKEGVIPSVRVGRSLRVSQAAYDAYLRSIEMQGPSR